jgi:inositol-pentakisphosphate 2-kinase
MLSTLQRTLDYLDIEGLSKLWQLSQSESDAPLSPIGSNSPEPSLQDWITFTDMYLSSVTSPPSPVPANLRYYLHAYLISASFKDCSIILRLPIDLDSDVISVQPGTVTVVDLDPKPMDRLRKWETLDAEIVGWYRLVKEDERKICIDAWTT